MDGLDDNFALKVAMAFQSILVLFFFVSPFMGRILHRGIAKASTLVLVTCVIFLIGNLVYMAMVYIIYPIFPVGLFDPIVWVIMSFSVAFSVSVLVGRYLHWMLTDNFDNSILKREYNELSDNELMPFDRRRKREMERRKRSRHD